MDRPDKLNAMNTALVDELSEQLTIADKDPQISVIIVAGEGRSFCAGADLSSARRDSPPSKIEVLEDIKHSFQFYQQIVNFNTPIIAAVQGYVLGGGCNLAVSCDLVVAADNALFGYPEVKLGMVAAGVTPTLVHQIGRKAAFELLVLCDNIDAEKALRMGIINQVVSPEQLMNAANEMARQLAGFDHDALWMTKQLIRRSADLPLNSALDLGLDTALAMNMYKE
jgi:enoyl-CoA hydratase/carnithine racemase